MVNALSDNDRHAAGGRRASHAEHHAPNTPAQQQSNKSAESHQRPPEALCLRLTSHPQPDPSAYPHAGNSKMRLCVSGLTRAREAAGAAAATRAATAGPTKPSATIVGW